MSTIAFESTRPKTAVEAATASNTPVLELRCPVCGEAAGRVWNYDAPLQLTCAACGFVIGRERGIWRTLAPSRQEKLNQFIQDYQTVRLKEGRGTGGVHYFLSLPYKDVTGRNAWQWKIRGRSYRYFERHILAKLNQAYPDGMNILDVGAGNCWMSYRLARRGHRPVAVDLQDNDMDGLAAARHYLAFLRRRFPRFQAEMDCLPFAPAQFDLVVFNAAFHYSEDYERTLREAIRCLRRPGYVLIADSPFYTNEASGQAMIIEKHAMFEKKYGFRSDSVASREFLTKATLDNLGKKHGVDWKLHQPWYGWGWALRPWKARIFRGREPAMFYLAWGIVN